MLRHVFKLVWNRKKANVLVGIEIFFSFLVLIGVLTMAASTLHNLRQPLGFSTDGVWSVNVDQPFIAAGAPQEDRHPLLRALIQAAKALPEVTEATATQNVPYSNMTMRNVVTGEDRKTTYYDFAATADGLKDVLGLGVTRGRWFSREDDGAPWVPTVINGQMAREIFGDADPVGKELPRNRREPVDPKNPVGFAHRVVGVLGDFRMEGQYQAPRAFAWYRMDIRSTQPDLGSPFGLAIKVRPGTPRSFEAALARTLHAVAPDLTFTVTPLGEMERTKDRDTLLPIVVGFVMCGFLLLMVALGLTGVLWESVTRRTREIGLRRAVGASGVNVAGQLVLEIGAVTTFAVGIGAFFVAQLPVLHLLGGLPLRVWVAGLAGATIALYLLSTLCALYPGWLAMRVLPSHALRDE